MLDEGVAIGVDDTNSAICWDFEGLIVGSIFLGFLRHEANVGNRAHSCRIKSTVLFTEIDGGLVDAGVGGVGNDGFGILSVTGSIPHLT